MQNLQIDPTTRDYIVVNGSPVESDRVLEAANIALRIPKKKWLYANELQGSLLYTLENVKRTSSIEQLFSAYATQAIHDNLITAGKASAVDVYNLATSTTGTSNEIDITPSASQISNQLGFNSV